jgi:hypothetical protein
MHCDTLSLKINHYLGYHAKIQCIVKGLTGGNQPETESITTNQALFWVLTLFFVGPINMLHLRLQNNEPIRA